MGDQRVKSKVVKGFSFALILASVASFAASWAGLIPAVLTENWYARWIYPKISGLFVAGAGLIGTSWLDVFSPGLLFLVLWLLYRRKVVGALAVVSAAYLVFFGAWGINYHRVGLEEKLDLASGPVTGAEVDALVRETADSLNRLYAPAPGTATRSGRIPGEDGLVAEADAGVRRTISVIDGIPEGAWNPRTRVKSSWLFDPFFRAAGIDGMFNPFGHEPIVTSGLLEFERPMAILHELAHVRGYPNEGDANFVALVSGVGSSDRRLQYSAWLTLWMYLPTQRATDLLDEGPRTDLEAAYARMRSGRVEWVDQAQSRALDSFLRANQVEGGVGSYSRIVELAVRTREHWDRYE